MLRGNDPAVVSGQIRRGQRVFCSDRGQRGGCGKTFALFFATILPRHTFNAPLLWALLLKLLVGTTIRAASDALTLPFSLETTYGLIRRVRRRQDSVRSVLYREHPMPASGQIDPLLQTLEHLQQIFAPDPCVLARYQRHFQVPFLR